MNEDLGPTPIQKINNKKVEKAIIELDIADKQFFHAVVQPGGGVFWEHFRGGQKFNDIKWYKIKSDQSCWEVQKLHGWDKERFPFAIALNQTKTQVFIVNTDTNYKVPLINLTQLH